MIELHAAAGGRWGDLLLHTTSMPNSVRQHEKRARASFGRFSHIHIQKIESQSDRTRVPKEKDRVGTPVSRLIYVSGFRAHRAALGVVWWSFNCCSLYSILRVPVSPRRRRGLMFPAFSSFSLRYFIYSFSGCTRGYPGKRPVMSRIELLYLPTVVWDTRSF